MMVPGFAATMAARCIRLWQSPSAKTTSTPPSARGTKTCERFHVTAARNKAAKKAAPARDGMILGTAAWCAMAPWRGEPENVPLEGECPRELRTVKWARWDGGLDGTLALHGAVAL